MYEDHFGLRLRPFSLASDPQFLFMTRQHGMALTMLEYGLTSESLISVLTGEVGSGKTTLIRYMIGRLGPDVTVGLINNVHRGSGKLLQWVAVAFDLAPRRRDVAGLYGAFLELVAARRAEGKRLMLIVDEAQNLGLARLEELRVLSNVNDGPRVDLLLVLVGQPELRESMRRSRLRQVAQRVGVDCHLAALTRDETREYVQHRLRVAGGSPELFSVGAVDLAHMHSGGVPRLLNQLCDTALVYGFADQRAEVDAALMEQVVRDRVAGGIFPSAATGLANTGKRSRPGRAVE
jgi:type II secretory pathway predicted ATPase ExeA